MTSEPSTPTAPFDEAKAEAFAERFLTGLSEASLMMMYSIGHRTGLFDAMDGRNWSTSTQIAEATALDERYVREWLGAMVTGRVVDYRTDDATYQLPAEHARWLTRRASPENLAVTSQWISVLGCVESPIVETFKTGGGLSYECFHRFHETMAEESSQTVVAALQAHILPLADGLADKLESGIAVLDVGCGSGRAACRMAEAFPASRFTGYDMCNEAIEAANAMAAEQKLSNARFAVQDITHLDEPEAYDLVTAFDIVHDQKDPCGGARQHPHGAQAGRHLPDAGHRRLQPPGEEPRPPDRTLRLHRLDDALHDRVARAGRGRASARCGARKSPRRCSTDAGFTGIAKHKLGHDFINVYFVMGKQ